MEKACRNKPLCVVVNVIVSLEDLISHFPETKASLGEGDHPALGCL